MSRSVSPAESNYSLPSSFTTPQEEIATLRRHLHSYQQRLYEVSNKSHKRTYTAKTLGRAIRRLISCYEPITGIINEGDRRAINAAEGISDSPPTTEEEVELAHEQNRTFAGFKLLIKTAPQITELSKLPDPGRLEAYISDLQDGANSARNDDNGRIKREVAGWLNNTYNPSDRLSVKTRENRGLQHDVCGKLLCPIEVDWDDDETREAVRNGTSDFNINESNFLRCLYPNDTGDPNNVEHNFLRSHWLLLTFYAVFISPSISEDYFDEPSKSQDKRPHKKQKLSAQGSRSSNKLSVSDLLHLNGRVTGRAIAYVAVLFVFNLTDAMTWTETYYGFSFHGLYNFIVDYFEDPSLGSRARVNSLITWWNEQIFPDHFRTASNSRASYKKLIAQRARLSHSEQNGSD